MASVPIDKPEDAKSAPPPPSYGPFKSAGVFHLSASTLLVTDPCLPRTMTESKFGGVVFSNCNIGRWKSLVKVNETSGRIAELLVFWQEVPDDVKQQIVEEKLPWSLYERTVCVDSGQVGMFDEKFYRKNKAVEGKPVDERVMGVISPVAENNVGRRWYAHCCWATNGKVNQKHIDASVIPGGVVSRAGMGDGPCEVYTYEREEKEGKSSVCAIQVVFMKEKIVERREEGMERNQNSKKRPRTDT